MVDVELIIKGYKCGKCKKEHVYDSDARECCKKIKIDWTDATKFELKQIHLDLLKEMDVEWNDCECGAPTIDPKRPYGNSDVEDDIARITKLKNQGNTEIEDGERCWNEKAIDYMEDLHKQTQIAIQIILRCQSFKLGIYKKEDKYFGDWKYIGEIK